MIEAGEVSGNLEKILDQLYLQLKKNHELTSKVRNAMIYPTVVFVMMIAVLVFMMVMVVPKIVGIFEGFGTELPLPTKILIALSNFVQGHGLLVVLGVALIVIIFIKINRTYKGKKAFQLFFLKFMVIGGIIKKINLARFSRTLSNLLKTDILVEKDFQITSSVLKNLYYREAVKEMSKELQQGTEINKVVEKYPKLFPPVILQMIAVGESSGNLDDMLAQIAEFYEKEVEDTMENLPSLIEPLLIIVLGIGVGALAVSIILPIYSLTTTI
jgi:type IV pilus assembly protein PilC